MEINLLKLKIAVLCAKITIPFFMRFMPFFTGILVYYDTLFKLEIQILDLKCWHKLHTHRTLVMTISRMLYDYLYNVYMTIGCRKTCVQGRRPKYLEPKSRPKIRLKTFS